VDDGLTWTCVSTLMAAGVTPSVVVEPVWDEQIDGYATPSSNEAFLIIRHDGTAPLFEGWRTLGG
jgi:hypothetical protein